MSTKKTYKGRVHVIPYRDQQREKVYRAERAVDWGEDRRGGMDLEQCQALAAKVVGSHRWRVLRSQLGYADGPGFGVTVEQAPHGGATAYSGLRLIRIAPRMMSQHVMLHELAHILCGAGVGHHWLFARVFADLVSYFMGRDLAKALRASYDAEKAKWRIPPKPVSDERRAQLREQGRAALAKWKEEKQ